MNTLLKKILIVLVIILILALAALLVYNFLIKKNLEEKTGPGELPEGKEGVIPGEKEGEEEITPAPTLKIKAISTERVLAPTLSADKTKVMYYSQYNGNVWQSAFNGSGLTRISSTVLNDLVKIIWSPDKTKVISIYQNAEGNIGKYYYNYETNQVFPLNTNMQAITWSSNSDKILFQYIDEAGDNNHLGVANPDGSNWQNIFQMRMKDINLDWLSPEIAFYEKPSGLTQSFLFILNPLNNDLTKVLSDIYGLSIKWSPRKDKFIFSQTINNGKNISLYVSSKDGTAGTNTNIPSFVEKCVWSQDNRTIFCAAPKNINEAKTLPDDFYKGSFAGNDDFWKVNLETGEITVLLESWERGEEIYDAVDLFLSPLEDYLFFVNKRDGLLYSIAL